MKDSKKSRIRLKVISGIFIVDTLTCLFILLVSYFTLLPPLKEKAIKSSENVNMQIIKQTDNLLNYITEYADSIEISSELKKSLKDFNENPQSDRLYQLVCLKLQDIVSYRQNIRAVYIETDNGKRFDSIGGLEDVDRMIFESNWYNEIKNNEFSNGFSPSIRIIKRINDVSAYTAAYCKNTYMGGINLTITVFFIATDFIFTTKMMSRGLLDGYCWYNAFRVPFYKNGYEISISEIYEALKNKLIQQKYGYIEKKDGFFFYNISTESNWSFASYVSKRALYRSFSNYFLGIIFLFILLSIITTLMLTIFMSTITKPISQLAVTMNQVSRGNLSIKSNISRNDEIGQLSNQFNTMIKEIEEYIYRLLEKEKIERRMKYNLLISQVDPHFIYNTMTTINYLARKKENDKIVEVNSALIKILRDRLRLGTVEVFDAVYREVGVVKQYLLIQSCRYGGSLEVEWEIEPLALDMEIPKNIIQPLVENSLFHGLIDDETGEISGKIIIDIHTNEESLTITVFDNGKGIPTDKLDNLNQKNILKKIKKRGQQIGLENIKERLAYLYNTKFTIDISSQLYEFTQVKITIPRIIENTEIFKIS